MPGQGRPDVDNRAVGCALRGHTAQRRRTRIGAWVRTRREVGALPRPGQGRWGVGVAMLAAGAGRWGSPHLPGPITQLNEERGQQRPNEHQRRDGPTGGSRRASDHLAGVLRYKPAIARRCSVSGPCTKAAAISGSVGPVPNEGQSLANTQTPHAGLRAWHTRRPWKITR